MKLSTLVVTRNKSVHIRTLHNLMKLNITCMKNSIQQDISFVKDDPFEKRDLILKKLKSDSDKILFIDYSIQMDDASISKIFANSEGKYNCLVFPCVREGINWEQFKKNVKENTSEPIEQCGLEFDTTVGLKITDDIYKVTHTNPKCWVLDTKNTLKSLKVGKKNGESLTLPVKHDEMFEQFKQKKIKIAAFVDANIQCVFSHECLGNIMNAAGVSQKVN